MNTLNYVHKDSGFTVTVLSETPNSVSFAPKGGGVVYRIQKALFQLNFEPAPVTKPAWSKALFGFESDDDDEATYSGYTDGKLWNGWECPWFALDEAQQIVADCPHTGSTYNPDRDCFEQRDYAADQYEAYELPAQSILFDGKYIRVYVVVDGWGWEEARDQPARKTPGYFSMPITREWSAKLFLQFLYDDGLLFHPEDDPAEVSNDGVPLFTDDEVGLLRLRMGEVHQHLKDPCAWALWLDKRFEITWADDGTSAEYPASWFSEGNGFAADDQRAMDGMRVGDTLHLGDPGELVSIRRTR